MKIWFDITNTPQVHFLLSIYNDLNPDNNNKFVFTAREFSETTKLLKQKLDVPFQIIGKHHGKSYLQKVGGLFSRFKDVIFSKIDFDISISCGSENAVWTSALRRKASVAFGDNDQARQWTYGHFVNYAFFPDAIAPDLLHRQGLKKNKLFLYPGYKEDIYLADYSPDPAFTVKLPFNEYVVVRPENLMANYIRNSSVTSITPALLRLLSEKGVNVLFLPRYETDRKYADGMKNIFIPEAPINGLDACYYSSGVLTGAGTFAREAACLGVPSFSFYAGSDLLAVDKKLISDKRMHFSRNPSELVRVLMASKRHNNGLSRSKEVKQIVMEKLDAFLRNID
jgi:uncharacterized protein